MIKFRATKTTCTSATFSSRTYVTSHFPNDGSFCNNTRVSVVLLYRCLAGEKEILSTSVTNLTRVQAAVDPHMWTTLCPRFRGKSTNSSTRIARSYCDVEGCKTAAKKHASAFSSNVFALFGSLEMEAVRGNATCRVFGTIGVQHPPCSDVAQRRSHRRAESRR